MQHRASLSRRDRSPGLLTRLQLDGRIVSLLVAIIVSWIAFNLLTDGVFLTARNLWNLSVQTAPVGVMVGGMVLVIVMRHIDLSIGSILGLTGIIMAVVNARLLPDLWWSGWATLAVGLLIGATIGALQGAWIAYLGVPAFIVTLGGLLIWRGFAWIVTSGQTVAPLTDSFQVFGGGLAGAIGAFWSWALGLALIAFVVVSDARNYLRRSRSSLTQRSLPLQALVTGASVLLILGFILVMVGYPDPTTGLPRGMPVPVLIMIIVTAVMMWVVRATRFGRYVFAYGGNPEAARLAGIDTARLTVAVFAVMGLLSALAGAILTARLNAGTNSTGTLAELSVIAAAIIGGTSLSGGIGSIPGAFLGALLMATLINGMLLVDLSSALQNVVQGFVLVLAVTVDAWYRRKSAR